jgi:hypothetical protein
MTDVTKSVTIDYNHGHERTYITATIRNGRKMHIMKIDIDPVANIEYPSFRGMPVVSASIVNGQRQKVIAKVAHSDMVLRVIDLSTTDDRWFPQLPQSVTDFIAKYTT